MHQLGEGLRRENVLLVEGSAEVGRLGDNRAQQQVGRELEEHSDSVEEDSLRVGLEGGRLGKLEELRRGAEVGNVLGIPTLQKPVVGSKDVKERKGGRKGGWKERRRRERKRKEKEGMREEGGRG